LIYKSAVLVACLGLVGCGAIYTSPKVSTRGVGNADVRVIKMTDQTAYAANLSAFVPQRLPAVFNSVPGARLTGGGSALPLATTDGGARPSKPQTFLPPAANPGPYQIGVSDVLQLATPAGGNTVQELSGLLAAQNKRQGYSVQGDGSIAIPDVGRIQVAGMTLDAAEAAVFDALVSKNIEPAFSLDVAEFNSQRATIGGAVGNPTIAPITPKPLYLEEAIQLAGGISAQNLDYTSIRMYRAGKLYQISARDLYKSAGRVRLIDSDSVFVDTEYELNDAQTYFAEQITLNNAKRADRDQALNRLRTEFNMRTDQIKVGQNNFKSRLELGAVKRQYAYRIGEFKEQGRFALPFEQRATLADALYDSRGLSTKEADLSQIYVLRRTDDPREVSASTAYHLNGSNPVQMLTATVFELRPNDIIFVSEQPVTAWNRVIAQITPQLLSAVVTSATP
jgi:polysaccharide export outer membrane protein